MASFCTLCKYRVYLNISDCLSKSIYSVQLYNIHKYNHLVIIIRKFVGDNCFQVMFVINILTSFYHFNLVTKSMHVLLSCTQIYKIPLCLHDKCSYLTEAHTLKSRFIYEGLVTIFINDL